MDQLLYFDGFDSTTSFRLRFALQVKPFCACGGQSLSDVKKEASSPISVTTECQKSRLASALQTAIEKLEFGLRRAS